MGFWGPWRDIDNQSTSFDIEQNKTHLAIVIGTVILILFIILFSVLLFVLNRKKRAKQESAEDQNELIAEEQVTNAVEMTTNDDGTKNEMFSIIEDNST